MGTVRAYIGLGANVGDVAGDADRGRPRPRGAAGGEPGRRLAPVRDRPGRESRTSPTSTTRSSPWTCRRVRAQHRPHRPAARSQVDRAGLRPAGATRYGPRELDLDLLLFGEAHMAVERPEEGRSPDPAKATRLLEVPHPEAGAPPLRAGPARRSGPGPGPARLDRVGRGGSRPPRIDRGRLGRARGRAVGCRPRPLGRDGPGLTSPRARPGRHPSPWPPPRRVAATPARGRRLGRVAATPARGRDPGRSAATLAARPPPRPLGPDPAAELTSAQARPELLPAVPPRRVAATRPGRRLGRLAATPPPN